MIRKGQTVICVAVAGGRWRCLRLGERADGPKYRDLVKVTAVRTNAAGLTMLDLAEWPSCSFDANWFRPLKRQSKAHDVALFLPLLGSGPIREDAK